jgi:hypothetical protein
MYIHRGIIRGKSSEKCSYHIYCVISLDARRLQSYLRNQIAKIIDKRRVKKINPRILRLRKQLPFKQEGAKMHIL